MNMDRMEEEFIAHRAIDWLYRLRTANVEERAAFVRWVKGSPRHLREILVATAWDQALRNIDPERRIDISGLLAQCASNVIPVQRNRLAGADPFLDGPLLDELANNLDKSSDCAEERGRVTPIRRLLRRLKSPESRSGERPSWKIAAALPAIALATLLVWMLKVAWLAPVIVTEVSEWRERTLADGSVVRLGPRTRVHIEFVDDRRLIHLTRGEATFKVAKDPLRPFVVVTETAVIRAVGTEFAVNRLNSKLLVTVAEGNVIVSQIGRRTLSNRSAVNLPEHDETATVNVSAGEQVTVSEAPLLIRHIDVKSELAWVDGWLIFRDETLAEAVDEFNRRNDTQIVVADPSVAALPVRGRFRVADSESFARFLETSAALAIVRGTSGTLRLEPQGGP
ncbi:MAG: FecR family protein [Steroidobacter sp.]